jgi:Rrf2 family protein
VRETCFIEENTRKYYSIKEIYVISNKTISAIEVSVFLARNANHRNITTEEMSSRLEISVSYLEYLLKTLKQSGIVAASKGPGGGYHIQGRACDITVWKVAQLFEKTLQLDPADPENPNLAPSAYELGLQAVIRSELEASTLADFVNSEPQDPFPLEGTAGRFRMKPLSMPLLPKAANSVFQWHTVI